MRRVLTIAIVFLACGFVANILIACAFAALEFPGASSMFFVAEMRRHYWEDQHELKRSIDRENLWVSDARQGFGCDLIRINEDSQLAPDGRLNRRGTLNVRRAGWPLRCLTGFEVVQGSRRMEWAIRAGEPPKPAAGAPPTPVGAGDVPPMLPLKPIWPAFALNWLIVTAMLWTLWVTHLKCRRAIRRLNRRCWSCGYPMGGSNQCSECGAAIGTTRRRNAHAKLSS